MFEIYCNAFCELLGMEFGQFFSYWQTVRHFVVFCITKKFQPTHCFFSSSSNQTLTLEGNLKHFWLAKIQFATWITHQFSHSANYTNFKILDFYTNKPQFSPTKLKYFLELRRKISQWSNMISLWGWNQDSVYPQLFTFCRHIEDRTGLMVSEERSKTDRRFFLFFFPTS